MYPSPELKKPYSPQKTKHLVICKSLDLMIRVEKYNNKQKSLTQSLHSHHIPPYSKSVRHTHCSKEDCLCIDQERSAFLKASY